MSRRISLLVAATTSAVVLAFVIPLALLVRNMAADRARADGDHEARNIAILVSSLHGDPSLPAVVAAVDARSPALTTVVTASGQRFGSGSASAADPDVARGRAGAAYTISTAQGVRIVVPVLGATGTDVVITDVSNAQLRSGVVPAWLALAALGLVMIGLALLVAGRIGRRISTPVVHVAAIADRLRDGDLDARAALEGPPETRALAVALNRLGERITELLVAERRAVGDMSHRLRTPVTALRIDLDGVGDEALAERMRLHVANLQRAIDAVIKDARRPLQHQVGAACDAASIVAERVAFWSVLAEDQSREVRVQVGPGPVRVALDAADLADLVDILLDNVFAHTDEGVGFSVSLESLDGHAVLTIADDGSGTGADHATAHGRTGLGLQIVRRTVAAGAGDLDISIGSPEHAGTRVTVRLPLIDEQHAG